MGTAQKWKSGCCYLHVHRGTQSHLHVHRRLYTGKCDGDRGAGNGATTTVYIGCPQKQLLQRADDASNMVRSRGSAGRMDQMIKDTGAPRASMPNLMRDTGDPRAPMPGYDPSPLTVELPSFQSTPIPVRKMMKKTRP